MLIFRRDQEIWEPETIMKNFCFDQLYKKLLMGWGTIIQIAQSVLCLDSVLIVWNSFRVHVITAHD